jgi:hypothetical protein
MKNSRIRAKKVRRRKVANLAAYSLTHSVSNCTIPSVPESELIDKKVSFGTIKAVKGKAEWTIPKEGYPQPKSLRKKYKKKYYNKDGSIRKVISHDSDYAQYPDPTFRPKGHAWFMEQMVQHKLAKWEKKNPCPVKTGDNQPDLFEQEYVIPWKAEREIALERIRDFVVSIYDKLPLTGRFKKSETEYVEQSVAELKDKNGEGHHINDLDPKKSKLLKKAQKKTDETKAKHANLICTNLKDHKRQKGRLVMPKAA